MNYEKKQSIYKIIMLIIITVSVSVIGTTIVLYEYWGKNESIKYVMLPTSNTGVGGELSKIRSIVDKYYLGEIDEQKLNDGAIKGYVSGLNDEYSEYIPKKEMETFEEKTTGSYEGIGIYYGKLVENGKVVIIAPIKDTPAYNAGILPGDIILKINDEDVKNEDTLTELSNRIKGQVGTQVKLTVERSGEIKEFTIERANIKLRYVYSEMLDNNVGYIEISSFDEDTAKDFQKNLEELKNQGMRALIIDLRDNGGGIVQESTKIADLILKKDSTILITKDKNGKEEITKATMDESLDMPIVVLANSNSASASEILIGALRDNGVAKIVGEKTFGKGIIQNVFTLTNGAGLKLTTSEYFTPNNCQINHVGIQPDVEVSLPDDIENSIVMTEEQDTQLQKAIDMLNN